MKFTGTESIHQTYSGVIEMQTESGKRIRCSANLTETELGAERSDHQTQTDQVPRGWETVLLTEDEPQILALVARTLSREGYNVIEAANGIEALRLAGEPDSCEINLLFTDMAMPQMSGIELATELRIGRPKVKVIFASGNSEEAVLEHGLSEGVTFLQKPFMLDDLARKVRDVLDG